MRSRSKAQRSRLLALLLLAILLAPSAARAGKDDLIGGDGLIPINPDFELVFAPGGPLNVGGTSAPLQFQDVISTALLQALGPANRPSVTTPYVGSLAGEKGAQADTFGSLVTNKATTTGKGQLAIGLSYLRAEFDSFDGRSIGHEISSKDTQVENGTLPIANQGFQQTIDSSLSFRHVRFTAEVVTLSVTYGLIDRLDIGALIPYIFLRSEGRVTLKSTSTTRFEGGETFVQSRKIKGEWDNDFEGLGDIVLFAKYQILSQGGALFDPAWSPVDLAFQTEVKLPTGDEDEFLGTDETDVAFRLLGQREIVANTLRVRGEIGTNLSGVGSEFHSTDAKLGLEFEPPIATETFLDNIAFSGEVLGSYTREFEGQFDAAFGAKYANPTWGFAVFAGLRVPLNENGLRYKYQPIVGVEKSFGLWRLFEDDDEETPAPAEGEAAPAGEKPAEAAPADPAAPAAPASPAAPAAPPAPGASLAPPAAPAPAQSAAGIPAAAFVPIRQESISLPSGFGNP